jgi:hypothetical protein
MSAKTEELSFIKPVVKRAAGGSTTLAVSDEGAKAFNRIVAHYAKKAGAGAAVSRKGLLDSIVLAEAKRLRV